MFLMAPGCFCIIPLESSGLIRFAFKEMFMNNNDLFGMETNNQIYYIKSNPSISPFTITALWKDDIKKISFSSRFPFFPSVLFKTIKLPCPWKLIAHLSQWMTITEFLTVRGCGQQATSHMLEIAYSLLLLLSPVLFIDLPSWKNPALHGQLFPPHPQYDKGIYPTRTVYWASAWMVLRNVSLSLYLIFSYVPGLCSLW